MWVEKHDIAVPYRAGDTEFRDYTPPPAHHRHTERLTEPRIPMGHEPLSQISTQEAERRMRQISLGVHVPSRNNSGASKANSHNRLSKGLAEVFGDE